MLYFTAEQNINRRKTAMRPNACRLFICLCLASFLAVSGTAFSADSAKDELIEKIKTFQEDWTRNASFTGTFTFKSKQFFSEEEAAAAKIGEDDLWTHMAGRLSKKEGKYRMQLHELFQQGADAPNSPPSPEFYDRITNGTFFIGLSRYKKGVKTDSPFNGSLSLMGDEPATSIGRAFKICQNPWTFITQIFKDPSGEEDLDESSIEYSDIDKERAKLTATGKYGEKRRLVKEITVRTDLPEPEIEQITVLLYDNETDQIEYKRIQKVVEWKISDGRKVPAEIRSEYGHLNLGPGPFKEMWFVSEWKCDDIGDRPVEETDFIIKLDRKDRIAHLSSTFKKRKFNIDELTEDDYNPYVGDYADIPNQEFSSGKTFLIRLGLLVAGSALVVFGILRFYKERKG